MSAGSGPRHTDWSHVHVKGGDKDKAAPYLPDARKLLGFVMGEAKRNNLGSHKIKRVLDDGTVIIAEKIGDIPRMTIIPGGAGGEFAIRTLEGFFATRAGGVDSPILFTPPTESADWKALFQNSEATGYSGVPTDRRGSYADVFGSLPMETVKRLATPGGIWVDPVTEEAVTWFQGFNGYWPEHWRHPRANYSRLVSIYGHTVLLTENPAWRVMSAAMKDGWLYVLVCEDLGILEPPERPAAPSVSGEVWYSQPYTDATYTYTLMRYPLAKYTVPETRIETYRVVNQATTGEQLWTSDLELAYAAWSFNEDVTNCVSVQLPRKAVFAFKVKYFPDYGISPYWSTDPDEQAEYPEAAAHRMELAITHGVGTPGVTFTSAPATSLAAEANGVQLTIETAVDSYSAGTFSRRVDMTCGDMVLPLTESTSNYTASPRVAEETKRTILFAHLPTRTFLFYVWSMSYTDKTIKAGFELYVAGAEVTIPDTGGIDETLSAMSLVDVSLSENHMRVMGVGVYEPLSPGTYAWFRELDAVSFLLSVTLNRQYGVPAAAGGPVAEPAFGYGSNIFIPFRHSDYSAAPELFAGGYCFSSVGGSGPWTWMGSSATYAKPYYPSNGVYEGAAPPAERPFLSSFGSAATNKHDVLACVKLQPVIAAATAGTSTETHVLANALRSTAFGTRGDAVTVLDPTTVGNEGDFGFGQTGKPMKYQKKRFKK